MPISPVERSPQPSPAALEHNRRGVLLRSQGKRAEAIAAFRDAVSAASGVPELHANLALTLFEHGDFDGARGEYARVLESDRDNIGANLAMYELEQIAGNPSAAIEHQARALAKQSLFSEIAPRPQRSVLVLLAPGDWQANVPIDFLLNRETTTVHKFYLLSEEQIAAAALPPADVAFMAIAESDENVERLQLARALIDHLGIPSLNDPQKVLATSRTAAAAALRDVPAVHAPHVARVSRDGVAARAFDVPFPIVIRPVGSHAGRGLERIDEASQLPPYLERVDSAEFYVMPFVDFRKDDGFYRKYRIIFVDGEPYPFHLAVSPRWMIHYYNAPMAENAWMRDEERRFLDEFETVFGPDLQQALRGVARAVGLEYFGLDCSIDREGRLLVFEADPAMIVHANDDPQLYAYKRPAAQRIFAAFERLLDRARSR